MTAPTARALVAVLAALTVTPTISTVAEVVLLLQKASASGSVLGLLQSAADPPPAAPVQRTLSALDADGNERVDVVEIRNFALSRGMDPVATSKDFGGLDQNGDGVLDRAELGAALSEEAPEVAEGEEAPPALRATAAARQRATSELAERAAAPPPQEELHATPEGAVEPVPAAGTSASMVLATRRADAAVRSHASEVILEALKAVGADRQAALDFERKAEETRAEAAALARTTKQNAMNVSATVAAAKAKELLASVTLLEKQALDAEVQASELRAGMRASGWEAALFMAAKSRAGGTSADLDEVQVGTAGV